MEVVHTSHTIQTNGQGLYEFTGKVKAVLQDSGVTSGLCTLFVRHTSASLLIQENADPSARHDLEVWLRKLVPENDPNFTHTFEGADDMPAHIKSALTATSLSIPIVDRKLVLGTWQGTYLWEHRDALHHRTVVISCMGEV